MQWTADSGDVFGFSTADVSVVPWLPPHPDADKYNVQVTYFTRYRMTTFE